VLWWLTRVGCCHCLFVSQLAPTLCGLTTSAPPLEGEVDVYPWRRLSWRSSHCSWSHQRVLRSWCGYCWGGLSPCAMPTRSGEVDLSFSIRSRGGPSVESPVLVHYWDGGPPRAESMMMASKPSPMGERHRPPKRSVMN
jgi:hypothetical protein